MDLQWNSVDWVLNIGDSTDHLVRTQDLPKN